MSGADSVRSLRRGLLVLQAINQHNALKAAEIARVTEIPRATVYRLLETLEEMKFVSRDYSNDKWRATLHAKSLSSGFRDEDWVLRLAVPEMVRLGRQIQWPIDLVTCNNYRMHIRESTHRLSPYSIDHGMVGLELPVLETSGGRAYLAFSAPRERDHCLDGLKAELGLGDPFFLPDGRFDQILAETRTLGVGFRRTGYRAATQSISAPIRYRDRVVACITIIWIKSALAFDRALELHRDQLLSSADTIARGLAGAPDSLEGSLINGSQD